MNQYYTKFPVAFIVINRPECTRKVFSRIAEAQPTKLFIIADGPRRNVIGGEKKCREVRSIDQDIDWDGSESVRYDIVEAELASHHLRQFSCVSMHSGTGKTNWTESLRIAAES